MGAWRVYCVVVYTQAHSGLLWLLSQSSGQGMERRYRDTIDFLVLVSWACTADFFPEVFTAQVISKSSGGLQKTFIRLHPAVLAHNPWGLEIYFHRIPKDF